MLSNGNSFGSGPGQAMGNVSIYLHGETRNTEPAYVRWLAAIQPGAVS